MAEPAHLSGYGRPRSRQDVLLLPPAVPQTQLHRHSAEQADHGPRARDEARSPEYRGGVPAPRRAARDRPHPRRPRRQDRAQPADERDAGGDGAGAVQVVVRGLRAGVGEGAGSAVGAAARPRRAVPGVVRGVGAGGDSVGLGGRNAGDYADLNPESWSARSAPDEVVYVDLANTKWGVIEATETYPWADAPSRARRVVRHGDSLVGTVRPGNGSFTLIADEGYTASTGFAVLRPRRRIYEELVYFAATSSYNITRLAHLADGAAYPAVRSTVVSATTTVLPSDIVVESFSKAVRPLTTRIAASRRESGRLAAQRDALLPRLVSGAVRVDPRP